MKLRIGLLIVLLIFVGVYGWKLYPAAINSYQCNKDYEKACAESTTKLEELNMQVDNLLSVYSQTYNCPKKGAIYDFCNQFVESGFTLNKITAKKLAGTTSTTIASYNTIDETHNITDADLLEIVFITEDNATLLNYLDAGNFAVDRVTIYPTDNAIIVTFVVGGDA